MKALCSQIGTMGSIRDGYILLLSSVPLTLIPAWNAEPPDLLSAHAQMRASRPSAIGLVLNYREREGCLPVSSSSAPTPSPSLHALQNLRTLQAARTPALFT